MRCEIEIEFPEALQGKWEPVAVRRPKSGEQFLDANGRVLTSDRDYETVSFVIVEPVWQWPEWLKAKWIAMDANGAWWAYAGEPDCDREYGEWSSEGDSQCVWLDLIGFDPPPCTDWRNSKRRNPNCKDAT